MDEQVRLYFRHRLNISITKVTKPTQIKSNVDKVNHRKTKKKHATLFQSK